MNIRILSFNIHKGYGWSARRYTFDQFQQHILKAQEDILFLQEVRGIQFDVLQSDIWPHLTYGKNAVYQKGHHGNAILSKYPIIFTNNIDLSLRRYERRGLLHVVIQLPVAPSSLHVFCVHLGLLASDRRKQLQAMVNYINKNVAEYEPIILAGDFNDWRSEATLPMMKQLNFQEAFLEEEGAYAKTYPSWAPMLKLDRIYYRGFNVLEANRLINAPWKYLSDHIALAAKLELRKIVT